MAPPKAETCAALCDEVAESVHPNFALLATHGQEVKATADGMLARLDEVNRQFYARSPYSIITLHATPYTLDP